MRFAWIDAEFLEVTGADRIDFVHGLVTNDVRGLADGAAVGALLLNHRGHALAQMTVIRLPDRLLLAVEDGMAAMVKEEFAAHIIFDQVELRPVSGYRQLALPYLEQLPPGLEILASLPRRRSQAGGIDVFLTAGAAGAVTGWTPLSERELELARVQAAAATAAGEAGPGVLPQEAGLEHLVSYRKGCYLGQEIMARIEARGKLQRGLRKLTLDSLPEQDGRDITCGGRKVGRLGTVAASPSGGWLALAVMRLDVDGSAELEVGGTTARLAA